MGDSRGPEVEAQARPLGRAPPLWKWTVNLVNGVSDRSCRLVSKVLAVSSPPKASVASDAEFLKCTAGYESWTQPCTEAFVIDNKAAEGLDNPVWRMTTAVDTGEVLESIPYSPDSKTEVPDGPREVLTTIWYGTRSSPRKPKVRHNLLKGVRTVASVFLLEGLVLLCAVHSGQVVGPRVCTGPGKLMFGKFLVTMGT